MVQKGKNIMVIYKHRNLNKEFYKKLEKTNRNAYFVFEASGYILGYEVFNSCVLVSLDVTFPDKDKSSIVNAYFFTTDKMKSELVALLYQAKAFNTNDSISLSSLLNFNYDICITKNCELDFYEVCEIRVNESSYFEMNMQLSGDLSERCIVGDYGEDHRGVICNEKCNR